MSKFTKLKDFVKLDHKTQLALLHKAEADRADLTEIVEGLTGYYEDTDGHNKALEDYRYYKMYKQLE